MNGDARRVLIVEDDESLALALRDLLHDDGFEVESRHDGESGLRAGLEQAFDLIILDLMLPRRSGFSVCEELRRAGVRTPLMILTAKDGELDEVECLDIGADAFLRKPFERAVLLAHLHALLRRHEQDSSRGLVHGIVEVDPVRSRVTVDGQAVPLTPREMRVLECLVIAEGEPCTKAELLDEVWGSDFEGDPNIVEVYVGYLRRKFADAANAADLIRTVRGVGYQLAAER